MGRKSITLRLRVTAFGKSYINAKTEQTKPKEIITADILRDR